MSTVLVTGGTGFLAGWTIRKVVEQGHTVRTTVRSSAKSTVIVDMLAAESVDTSNLSFAVADLGSSGGGRKPSQGSTMYCIWRRLSAGRTTMTQS